MNIEDLIPKDYILYTPPEEREELAQLEADDWREYLRNQKTDKGDS